MSDASTNVDPTASNLPTSGIGGNYPNFPMNQIEAATAAAGSAAMAVMHERQADADRFMTEYGAAVVSGHPDVSGAPSFLGG